MVAVKWVIRGFFCLATVITVLSLTFQVWLTIYEARPFSGRLEEPEYDPDEDSLEDWAQENLENFSPLEAIVVDAQENIYYDEYDFILRNVKDPHNYAKEHGLPIIIWWTPFTGENAIKRCSKGDCYFTQNRKLRSENLTKVFLFYGTDLKTQDLPLPRASHHEWGLFHEESPLNNFLLLHEKTLELFNHTSTFQRTSHYPIPLQHITSLEDLTRKPRYNITEKNYFRQHGLAPVSFVQSNCNPPSDREAYVKELMKYLHIDSLGSCLHNKDMPKQLASSLLMTDKRFCSFISKYKFSLAYENFFCDDYMTEKLWRPLEAGSVPIYAGSPSVQDWLPDEHSVILIKDFETPQKLAEFVNSLDQDDDKYLQYLEFKEASGVQNQRLKDALENRKWGVRNLSKMNVVTGFECYVCDKIHENLNLKSQGEEKQHSIHEPSHLQCPHPVKLPSPSPDGDDVWKREMWQQVYKQSKEESEELFNLVMRHSWHSS